jgi:replicative DNA helicase
MVCAQSGHGKTAFALNLVNDIALDQDYTVYYANAEMRPEELTQRIVANRAQIPASEIMSGRPVEVPKEVALERIFKEYSHMREKQLILSRVPMMSITTLRRAFRILANRDNKPHLILVDYVGRLELEGGEKGLQEWQKLYQISENLKALAVELDIPIVALAQLNEDGMIEGAKKMKNACDGVLFFEPIPEGEEEGMTQAQRRYANYRLKKYKVRRNDNSKPIYFNFDKKYQSISEVL